MSALGDLLRSGTPAPEERREDTKINWSVYDPPGASSDLQRILALPVKAAVDPVAVALEYTNRLKRAAGTMVLKAVQALALLEAELVGGLLASIGVGEGKTLLSFLLPVVMKARKTVLLIPPALREQTIRRAHPELAKHWRIPNLGVSQASVSYPDVEGTIHVVAYSELSSARTADILERLQPDLIVCDEAHKVRNFDASCTKRFRRYFKAFPNTKLCALSGTLISKSIRDISDLAKFALRERAPIPLYWPTLEAWSEALDPGDWTPPPGELLRLCQPGETVHEAFRRRLWSTPGCIASNESNIGSSLIIHRREVKLAPEVKAALDKMRGTWTTPNGEEEFDDALTFARHARDLSTGLYFRWIWPQGEPVALRDQWMECRRDWHKTVRERLKASIPGQDSVLLCSRAAESGTWKCPAWEPWRDIKDLAHPESEAVWVSEFLVEDAVRWAQDHKGLIWLEHPAMGEAFARRGVPFYGAHNKDRILEESGNRAIALTRGVFYLGTDGLQERFNEQLILAVSPGADINEQLLGRLHREKQKAGEVETYVYLHTPELAGAFADALKGAQWIEKMEHKRQKLSYATVTCPLL